MNQFAVVDNCLQIGGRSLTDVAAEVGSTPFYAYDSAVMSAQVEKLRTALPPGIHLHYAMKANPMPAVVQHMAGITDGLDVASAGELQVASGDRHRPPAISVSPVRANRTKTSPRPWLPAVIINMESEGEMARIAALAATTRHPPAGRHSRQPRFRTQDFRHEDGWRPQALWCGCRAGASHAGGIGLPATGLHGFSYFLWLTELRPEAIIEAQTKTFELAFRLAESAPGPVRWLNIGGGLGVPYFPGGTAPGPGAHRRPTWPPCWRPRRSGFPKLKL